LYALPDHLSGNDGISYNLQYTRIVQIRTNKIQKPNPKEMNDCFWLFPDPENDTKTMVILGLNENKSKICP
jgi:hypothetical protein